MERDLEIIVGGKRVDTNEFATQIVISTVTGLLKPLREVDTEQAIEIKIGASKA